MTSGIAHFETLARFAERRPQEAARDYPIHADLRRMAADLRDGRPLIGIAHEAETLAATGRHNDMDAARLRCLARRIRRLLK